MVNGMNGSGSAFLRTRPLPARFQVACVGHLFDFHACVFNARNGRSSHESNAVCETLTNVWRRSKLKIVWWVTAQIWETIFP